MDDERKRQLIWLGAILAMVLAVLAGGWLGRPVYQHYRTEKNLQQARHYFDQRDYNNAALCARQVLRRNPTNVPACRIMANLANLMQSPAALDWQQRIAQTEPTIENQLQLAATGLRYQRPPFPLTAQILKELAPAATNLASYQVVAASLALSRQQLGEAENHLETAARLDPTNDYYVLNLATLRLALTNEATAAAAREVLEKFRTNAALGPAALRSLVADRLTHRDAGAAKVYADQLLARPQATWADRLQYAAILHQLKSGDFAARLEAVQQEAATNAPAVAEVSAWMQANDLVADDLRWLTNLPAALRAQSPVRLALAEGYLQSADWGALRDFASQDKWGDMEFLRQALLARAWLELGVPRVAAVSWDLAMNDAGDRLSAQTTLLGLAERWKLPRERKKLLALIVEKFPHERWAQQVLEESYVADGNTVELNQLCAKLFNLFPQDTGLKNNLAATSLLLKTNLTQACQWAAEVYASQTNDPVAASTYAFALYLQGRNQNGLAVMQKLDARRLQQPDIALYYAVLLAATGATNEAAPYVKIARTNSHLLPEEKRLLEAAREAIDTASK